MNYATFDFLFCNRPQDISVLLKKGVNLKVV